MNISQFLEIGRCGLDVNWKGNGKQLTLITLDHHYFRSLIMSDGNCY